MVAEPALESKHPVQSQGKALGSELEPLISGKKRSTSLLNAPYDLKQWMEMLLDQYGYRLLLLLFASQHLMKGLVASLAGESNKWLFKQYAVPGPRMQIYNGVINMPWAVKPIIGMVSDLVPLGGYNKAPYILMTSLFGVCSFVAVGFGNNQMFSIDMTVLFLVLISLQASVCDLLTEAKYAEQLNTKPEYGPDLMTFVWGGITCGSIVALLLTGWLIATFGARTPYLVAILPAAFILWPTLKNYICETPRSAAETQRIRAELFKQSECFFLCILMLVATVFLSVVGIATDDPRTHFWGALATMLVVLVAFSVVLRPVIAKMNAFFLIQTSLGVQIGGAAFYFYTDTPAQYKNGPHFSIQFFTTVLGVVSAFFSLIGLAMYNKYMKDWKYRNLLLISNLLIAVLNIGDCLLFTRYNLEIGIPDHAFVLGSSISATVLGQWQWMPGVVILSQMCPKGMEATMYALLAGCHNLGNTLSEYMGAYLLEVLEVRPAGQDGEDAHFDKLWVAALVSSVLPVFTLFLLPWLIPDARQTDKLLEDNDRSATEGSLWSRWTRREEAVP